MTIFFVTTTIIAITIPNRIFLSLSSSCPLPFILFCVRSANDKMLWMTYFSYLNTTTIHQKIVHKMNQHHQIIHNMYYPKQPTFLV